MLKADFHIHSCHSACGSLDMSPTKVINSLIENNIKIAAISDHNSMKNSSSYISLGEKKGVCIFPAMEIQSEEEIHIIIVFPDLEKANSWQLWIDSILPLIPLNAKVFGDQPIVDTEDNIIELPENLLSISLPISFDEIENKASKEELLFFPAHINDSSYSLISQLGFIPLNHKFKIAEVSKSTDLEYLKKNNNEILLITNSDAHFPDQIGLRYNMIFSKDLFELFESFQKSNKNKINLKVYKSKIYEKIKEIMFNLYVSNSEIVKPVFNK